MNFDQAFETLIDNEGGFTLDMRDRGNWTSGEVGVGELRGTKFGISAMTYPTLNIAKLTIADAKVIYKRDFWDKINGDKLPAAIRFDMFDMAVNSGIKNACMVLQRAVDTKPDGVIGPVTIARLVTLDPQLVDKRLAAQRLLFLANIPSWPSYGKGWVRRVANNLMED